MQPKQFKTSLILQVKIGSVCRKTSLILVFHMNKKDTIFLVSEKSRGIDY